MASEIKTCTHEKLKYVYEYVRDPKPKYKSLSDFRICKECKSLIMIQKTAFSRDYTKIKLEMPNNSLVPAQS